MYTINGVSLDDPRFGWIFRRGSQPFITLSATMSEVEAVGRRGVAQYQTGMTAGLWTCVVNTPWAHQETLNALLTQPTLELSTVANPNRVAAVKFMASDVDTIYNSDRSTDMLFTLSLVDAAWRDKTQSTSPVVSLNSAATVNVAGLILGGSAPVQDAIVRIRGAASAISVTDFASGSWFSYAPALPAGSYLRFESASERAYVTTSDTWTGGTEVSGIVDFGGPSGGIFELTPVGAALTPQTRSALLTVTTGTRDTNASIQVRSRTAYVN